MRLSCNDGCVSATDAANDLECRPDYDPRLPSNLQALKALIGLEFICSGSMTEQLQFDCLALLPTLEHLHVSCTQPMQGLHLPECLSRLTNLSFLYIASGQSAGQTKFDFAWSKLVALQYLRLQGSLQSKHALSDLVHLGRLKHVALYCAGKSDAMTIRDVGQLADRISAERPEIKLYWV